MFRQKGTAAALHGARHRLYFREKQTTLIGFCRTMEGLHIPKWQSKNEKQISRKVLESGNNNRCFQCFEKFQQFSYKFEELLEDEYRPTPGK